MPPTPKKTVRPTVPADDTTGAPRFDIVIDDTPAIAEFTVNLVGHTYQVIRPKSALALAMAQEARKGDDHYVDVVDKLGDWLRVAFRDQSDAVFARLADPDDPLDWNHLFSLYRAMVAAEAGHPTS